MVCANTTGVHRVGLSVVSKYHNPQSFKTEKSACPLSGTKECVDGLWCGQRMVSWCIHVQCDGAFRGEGFTTRQKSGSFVAHPDPHPQGDGLNVENIFCAMFLPPCVTSLVQPVDQGVIQNVTVNCHSLFVHWCVNFKGSIQDFQKQFTLKKQSVYLPLAGRV